MKIRNNSSYILVKYIAQRITKYQIFPVTFISAKNCDILPIILLAGPEIANINMQHQKTLVFLSGTDLVFLYYYIKCRQLRYQLSHFEHNLRSIAVNSCATTTYCSTRWFVKKGRCSSGTQNDAFLQLLWAA